MAYDAFMWFEKNTIDVEGETADDTYKAKKAIEIYSFSWGMSNPVTIGSASSGAGAGKVSISSFNIMKKADAASAALMKCCMAGEHITKAHVVLRKAGGSALEYLKYDFEEVYVDSVQQSGSSGGDDTPTESVSFAFGKFTYTYQPQDKTGAKLGGEKTASRDLKANK